MEYTLEISAHFVFELIAARPVATFPLITHQSHSLIGTLPYANATSYVGLPVRNGLPSTWIASNRQASLQVAHATQSVLSTSAT